jgi:hypothetical protein
MSGGKSNLAPVDQTPHQRIVGDQVFSSIRSSTPNQRIVGDQVFSSIRSSSRCDRTGATRSAEVQGQGFPVYVVCRCGSDEKRRKRKGHGSRYLAHAAGGHGKQPVCRYARANEKGLHEHARTGHKFELPSAQSERAELTFVSESLAKGNLGSIRFETKDTPLKKYGRGLAPTQ